MQVKKAVQSQGGNAVEDFTERTLFVAHDRDAAKVQSDGSKGDTADSASGTHVQKDGTSEGGDAAEDEAEEESYDANDEYEYKAKVQSDGPKADAAKSASYAKVQKDGNN